MLSNPIADRVGLLNGEAAFEVQNEALKLEQQGRSVIHLEIGQPNFNTPKNIISACEKAMEAGKTGYTDYYGLLEAREAISDYLLRYKSVSRAPSEIVITPGAKPVMFFAMQALVNPGDEVILPNPGYPIYQSCIRFNGGIPVSLPIVQENDFRVDPDDLKKLITKKTKLIILNNPQNPTGGLMSREDIERIAEIVLASDAYVLSDEIYDRLIYDGSRPYSIAAVPGMKDRTILLDGLSKTYSMTGWRLGYGAACQPIADAMAMLNLNCPACTTSFVQWAAIEALSGPQDAVEDMRREFERRIRYLVGALNNIKGIECRMPRGAFYAFPRVTGTGLSSKEFAARLLQEAGVAVLDGAAFGCYGDGHVRLSAANSYENIKEAVRRIDSFVCSL